MPEIQPRIPAEGLEAIKRLLDLDTDQLTRLGQALEEVGPIFGLDVDRAEGMHSTGADFVSPDELNRILNHAILPMSALRLQQGLPSEMLYEQMTQALEQTPEADWPAEYRQRWSQRAEPLIRLLGSRALAVEYAAHHAMRDRPNWVQGLALSSELRPLIDPDAGTLDATLLTHTLSIRFRDEEKVRTLYLSLDTDDLSALKDLIEQARVEIKTILSASEHGAPRVLTFGAGRLLSEAGEGASQ